MASAPSTTDGTSTAPWGTIPELLADSCERFALIEALVEGDVRITYGELRPRVEAVARGLMALGVEKGDRVAIWAPNCWEWPVVALAAHVVGGVVVPVNTRFKGAEAEYALAKSRAKVLFTVTDFLDTDYVALLRDRPPAERGELPDLASVVVLRGPLAQDTVSLEDVIEAGASVSEQSLAERVATVGPDDLCHIMFTSGTTGAPKGVMLAHGPVCRAYWSWSDVVGLREGDRYLIVNPYFHSFGLNSGILACLMRGATNLPHAVFDVPQVMRRVVDDRISMLPGPPAIYHSILNHPDLDGFDMSSLRLAVTGAAAIPVELIEEMRAKLGFETIVTGYGLTESSGMATMCRHDDDPETIATTSGRAIPDVEVLVVDDDGAEVPRGEPGEMDERGYIRITDRKKDMFIVGGFNAYPAEIENLLLAHPDIAQVAVIGVPDDRMGEVGRAFVVPRTGTGPDPDALRSWAREHMANYKVPARFELVEALPLNAAGKVDKLNLRARAAGS